MFGSNKFSGQLATTTKPHNPMNDFEVTMPPEDSVSCLSFSPEVLQKNYLVAGSWDNQVRMWDVEQNGNTIPKTMQTLPQVPLDLSWSDDGQKMYLACCDKQAKYWDLVTNQVVQIAIHDAPVSSCCWIKTPTYSCLMTTSWDKTAKFWDTRTPTPLMTLHFPDKCFVTRVDYPYAVISTSGRNIHVYTLEQQPRELKIMESPLKHQHRGLALFRDKSKEPVGYAIGSVEGRVAIQYIDQKYSKDSFTFKCHRSPAAVNTIQDVYAVNDVAFHPVHGTLATVGSDGSFSFWDKDCRTRLTSSKLMEQPIIKCAFNHSGQIFAYAVGYDWSKGHEYANSGKKNCILLHSCFDKMKPR